jgi:ABC-type cobalamin/Fe3+-siderophores transport system ATPase subunit
MVAISAQSLNVTLNHHTILPDMSLEIVPGEITALVGPNGSGKSTLLKSLARLLKPSDGAVYLDGKAIHRMSTTAVARQLAILPQGPSVPEQITVRELVEQGRFPHAGMLRMLRPQDHDAIDRAIDQTGLSHLKDRPVDTLSGGERQRAWIALTLAQETPLLLLDEPTTYLDIGYQLEVLELVRELNEKQGKTIIIVLHDLNQAARYAHRMLALCTGTIIADGPPRKVLTEHLLESAFRIRAHVDVDPSNGKPFFLPLQPLTATP